MPCIMDRETAERLCKMKDLQDGLRELHKNANKRIDARCQREIDAHNATTNIVTPHSEAGDLVLISKSTRSTHKVTLGPCGSRRFVKVKSPAECVVEDLLTQKRKTIHATRIKKYCGKLDGTSVPEEVLDLANRTFAKYEVVESTVDIEKNEEGLWLRLQWEGLPDDRDYTQGLLAEIFEDIPDMVKAFLVLTDKKGIAEAAARHLGISL